MKNVHPKVAASGIAGAVAVVATFLLSQAGVSVPADVEAAIITVITFCAGYIKK